MKNEERANLSREVRIDLISLIILAGFVASVFICYVRGTYLGLGYPFNTFLFQPADRFMDYFNGLTYATAGHGEGMVGMGGLAYLLFRFFYHISFGNAYLSLVIYTAAMALYVLCYNLKNLLAGPFPRTSPVRLVRNLFILSFLSYPVLFTLDRGNVEVCAFVFLSLFVYFFCSNRAGVSTLFLAAATALKVYPFVFIILYLADKKYKESAIFVAALLFMSAFTYDAAGGFSFHLLRFTSFVKSSADPAQSYNALYVIGDAGAAFCSSAFGALKAVMYAFGHQDVRPVLLRLMKGYHTASLLLFGLVALYVIIVEKSLWKRIAILTLSMIFFPYVTGDYRLLHLYIPMWLFLNSEEKSEADLLYTILFALLLIPKAYYLIKGDISVSVILNPLIIFLFLVSMIATGLRNLSASDIKRSVAEHVTALRDIYRFGKAHSANKGGNA